MKKLLFIFLTAIIVSGLFLIGCTKTTTTTATATATTTATTTATVKPVTLIFSSHNPEQNICCEGFIKPYFTELEKRTGGKIKIESHWAGELAGPFDVYDAVVSGTIDIGMVIMGMLAGRFPLEDVMQFTDYTSWCYRRHLTNYELYTEFPELRAEFKKAKPLVFMGQPGYLGVKGKKITKLEDFKGVKYNSVGMIDAERVQALGMVPLSMPPADLYSALQTGVLSALPTTSDLVYGFGVGPVIDYINFYAAGHTAWTIAINADKFNSLPADVQKVMEDMVLEYTEMYDVWYAKIEAEAWDKLIEEFNFEVVDIPQGELARMAELDKPVFDKYIAGLDDAGLPGTEFGNEFLRLQEKYSAAEYAPE